MLETAVNTLFASVQHQIFDSSQEKYFRSTLFILSTDAPVTFIAKFPHRRSKTKSVEELLTEKL
jgi:hypothetical protein